ncbi:MULTISPECIES: hypothetical protein [Delftia]|uniref:Uncharacterized protein n=1 Tax=Delftia lacustris TaxID=558537 RepID=A0A1H3MTS7_9BURK|nr:MULTISPECIES: hypothetical protein [Delftia]QPS78358.1 hypothetical protein I6G48_32070 [Delftia acidovorans]QPS84918.1 hypothetical protein I6G47_32745 [Delftia lacustris]SDY79860.1 hypothetical protein SAMN05421547_10833 [Delftia lacustris]
MIVARPESDAESDLLSGHEHCVFRFVTGAGDHQLAAHQPPKAGWTHDALDAIVVPKAEPWDAFLGAQWVGSSEI